MIVTFGIGAFVLSETLVVRHTVDEVLQLSEYLTLLPFKSSLLAAVEGKSLWIEEYARDMIMQEELHAFEVDKMLRKPGDVKSFSG